VGRIPVTYGKMPIGKMEVLVKGDPEMRRTYVVVEANPQKFPQTNTVGAKALADWLVGDPGQKFLLDYGKKENGGIPLYYPIHVPGDASAN
jgi:tungstate transport system substrate-binding protein